MFKTSILIASVLLAFSAGSSFSKEAPTPFIEAQHLSYCVSVLDFPSPPPDCVESNGNHVPMPASSKIFVRDWVSEGYSYFTK